MALRDQPYLPLYIQDIMTDEKLNECCAATHGIFIKGIMCLMHKSEYYGKILLKQKDKQTDNQIKNFALKLEKHTPYSSSEIEAALFELLAEKVLYIEGDSLCQKRMIKDGNISEERSKAGKTGVETKKNTHKKFAKAKRKANASAKPLANAEYENENENESKYDFEVDSESYGKSENYFHGNPPVDLVNYLNALKPSSMKADQWQRLVAGKLRERGYVVQTEVACPYPSEDGDEIEGFIDIRAMSGNNLICIECDNRVITRDSVVKIHAYGRLLKHENSEMNYSGMVVLRDPKPPEESDSGDHPELENVYNSKIREGLIMAFRDVDVDVAWEQFKAKVRGAKKFYALHDLEGLRMAFSRHLQNAPKKLTQKTKYEIKEEDL
jgi:hypothetical protein